LPRRPPCFSQLPPPVPAVAPADLSPPPLHGALPISFVGLAVAVVIRAVACLLGGREVRHARDRPLHAHFSARGADTRQAGRAGAAAARDALVHGTVPVVIHAAASFHRRRPWLADLRP